MHLNTELADNKFASSDLGFGASEFPPLIPFFADETRFSLQNAVVDFQDYQTLRIIKSDLNNGGSRPQFFSIGSEAKKVNPLMSASKER